MVSEKVNLFCYKKRMVPMRNTIKLLMLSLIFMQSKAIERCPDCTKGAQLHDATQEIEQLAQESHSIVSRRNKTIEECPDCTKGAQLHEAPKKKYSILQPVILCATT